MLKRILFGLLTLSLYPAFSQVKEENKGDIYYEIFIRSFNDSDKDGIGDIKGITQKLDYLKELGITGIWITPIHPSPTYHKYDIIDYTDIDPEYGTLADYKIMVAEAHKRGIKILLDLVVNHTSSLHPWFIEACHNNPEYKNYYVWSDTVKQTQGWHSNPLNPGEKYYGFFWEGMPDLNFDNAKVRDEIKRTGRFWLKEVGVDGFRLDAAQHIYDASDVVKNNEWWGEFRKDMLAVNPKMILIGEVWNKDSIVATYLKNSLDACFNFDLSKAITQATSSGSAEGMVDKLISIDKLYKTYNPNYWDATFISNHDQDRYRSTFNNDTAKTKLAFAILMTLPGTPFLYYGEEIGMLGKSPDHYRREPFLWDKKVHATWEKPVYTSDATVMDLREQMTTGKSFYLYYKQLIALRKSNPLFVSGQLNKSTFASKVPKGVLIYTLTKDKRFLTVIHNTTDKEIRIPKSPKFKPVLLNGAFVQNVNFVLPPASSLILE